MKHETKKKGYIASTLGLLAGVPTLANAIGWTLTAISVALLLGLAVTLYRKVVGEPPHKEDLK